MEKEATYCLLLNKLVLWTLFFILWRSYTNINGSAIHWIYYKYCPPFVFMPGCTVDFLLNSLETLSLDHLNLVWILFAALGPLSTTAFGIDLERQTFAITTMKSKSMFWAACSLTTLFCQHLRCLLARIPLQNIASYSADIHFLHCSFSVQWSVLQAVIERTGLLFVSYCFCGHGESNRIK